MDRSSIIWQQHEKFANVSPWLLIHLELPKSFKMHMPPKVFIVLLSLQQRFAKFVNKDHKETCVKATKKLQGKG